ncbi:hypothetical protein AB4Z30_22235 [Paenibacillus sp. 2TAF8]|jgi:ATP-dependent Clp protease protease subunit|uniref:hypothetical protein n=1 Tax=Paenibacillus sp. 2TAF8 TaxID=3233020 RepID=UPI003F9A3564
MLDIQFAKSKMENEEGMNHLWIQVHPEDPLQTSEIQIQLPEGMYRSKNLSGLVENDHGHIVVDAPYQDVIIEIFTQDALECGELTIVVSLLTAETTVHQEISIQVVPEEEMDTAEINEHVVERIKALSNTSPTNDDDVSKIVYIQPKIMEQGMSHLEKNYRIDYEY